MTKSLPYPINPDRTKPWNDLPDLPMLINSITLQEAKVSSEIENVFTTDDEIYKAVSDSSADPEASGPTKEVPPYREALLGRTPFSGGARNIQP